MKPPVAILIYPVDNAKRAVFYPFAEFSPEWCAIRWAAAQGIPVRFFDLPQSHRLALEGDDSADEPVVQAETDDGQSPEPDDDAPAPASGPEAAAPASGPDVAKPAPEPELDALGDDPLGALAAPPASTTASAGGSIPSSNGAEPTPKFSPRSAS